MPEVRKPWPERNVRRERSGWRDLWLNERHRQWGFNCPAVDIDLFLEYYDGTPAGIIEYKDINAAQINMDTKPNKSIKALRILCNNSKIPFIVCRYRKEDLKFRAVPFNSYAREVLPENKTFSETEWVKFLYRLRGYECPQIVLDGLKITA